MNTRILCRPLLLAALLSCGAATSAVTFHFTAQLSAPNGPGADVISNLFTPGMLCSGTVSYDLPPASTNTVSTNEAYYEFQGTGMKIRFLFGTNVLTSTDSSSGQVHVQYQLPSPVSDGLAYSTVGVELNGGPVPGATDSQYVYVEMLTTNLDALPSDALPTEAPRLDAFIIGGATGYRDFSFYTYKGGNLYYGAYGNLTSVTASPVLSAQFSQGQLVLSWPATAPGFQLEATATLELPGSWNPVATDTNLQNGIFQVSVVPSGDRRFFRLSQR